MGNHKILNPTAINSLMYAAHIVLPMQKNKVCMPFCSERLSIEMLSSFIAADTHKKKCCFEYYLEFYCSWK
jgi:hypothetical protein